ncbi:Uncharacterized protein MSYG_2983 [Malassezia sympodialis ATCC 42132]|uniref:Uncharacterized protein n=1 Tax=Malassezia sympodialis (strain ATCC 42132) TaxID=1230383 RepID=A0A1M8A823_MALS4|nr:Uncharacterized protein MSYG_2983 [Malassezia sympodialis ATCC 42132]
MLSSVPSVLTEIVPFLQRAKEVERVDPVIAYWCKYYAAQIGIEKGTGHAEAQAFLLQFMDELEQLKGTLSENEAVTNDAIGQTYIENFALQIFLGADNEEREGKASRSTAQSFLAASKFLELLQVFGPLEPDMQTKIKYAKWKAAQISKALREGSALTPGPDKTAMEREAAQTSSDDASQAARVSDAEEATQLKWPQVPRETDAPQVHVMAARSTDQTSKPPAEAGPLAAQPSDSEDRAPESGLSVREIAHAQKLCRWASSALDYEDLETARTQLRQALSLLDGTGPPR